jgi:hypothetical protein
MAEKSASPSEAFCGDHDKKKESKPNKTGAHENDL